MKKTLAEVFNFMESIGWDVTVLDENYKGRKVYGISKPLDDDCICIVAPFLNEGTAVNLLNRINSYYENESAEWEADEVLDLILDVERFTNE
ncbi:MAG: hypothetical protein LUD81_07930 [Clostridiales bacterium]|nr:hypothetical protein [Clostridiales bacterium]